MTNVPRAELRNRAGGRRRVNSIRGRLKGFRDVSLARRKFAYVPPLHHPHSDQPLLSPKDGGHTPANCIDDSSETLAQNPFFLLFLSPSRFLPISLLLLLLLLLPSFFFFLYLLPAERPRVINQIIRRVRLDFCLATFEFGSRGFDEGKDCCGGVDLPSFPPSSRHTGSFPLSFVHGAARCVAAR